MLDLILKRQARATAEESICIHSDETIEHLNRWRIRSQFITHANTAAVNQQAFEVVLHPAIAHKAHECDRKTLPYDTAKMIIILVV